MSVTYDACVSTTGSGTPPRTRRRGAQLQAALLQAAWDELVESGYANFTMESVAARAQTGIAVLYRRWANKDELALAAFEYFRETRPVAAPDTGSLRGDLIELLDEMGSQRSGFFSMASGAAFSGMLNALGMTVRDFRTRVLGESRTENYQIIYERAHDRGEIDLAKLSDTVLDMPVDLVRNDLMLSPPPVARERIVAIVDELFLPLALLQDSATQDDSRKA